MRINSFGNWMYRGLSITVLFLQPTFKCSKTSSTLQSCTNTSLLNNIFKELIELKCIFCFKTIKKHICKHVKKITGLQYFNFLLRCKCNDFINQTTIQAALNQTKPLSFLWKSQLPQNTTLFLGWIICWWICLNWICHYNP